MSTMELELQLKLQDRMSRGLKAALQALQGDTKKLGSEFTNTAKAANSIKPTGIERMLKSMRELGKQTKSTLDLLNRTAQAGAAIAAGGYVVKRALDKPMDYDRKLALTSNVAYSDRDATGRIAGKMELDRAVRNAQLNGLGSQDQVLETLNQLIGSGAMGAGQNGVKNSIDLLPTIAKAATGSGAEPSDIAKIAIAAKQNMGMSNDEVKKFLSQSITAGNLGGFELKDMARYLPEQMASYAANGNKGMSGAQDLLAYNQVSRITAGNADQAGNNLVNLLNKINSRDTAIDFKRQGIDLTGSLASARSKGVGTLDAFMALVDRVASKDPQYKSLKNKASGQSGADQKQTIDAMLDLYEQKGIGMTVQDRQAMAALLAARQQKGKLDEVRNAVRADDGSQIDKNFAVINSTSSAASERLGNAKDAAASKMLSGGDSVIQRVLNGMASVATAHPVLAAAAYAAATALGAVAAMSGMSTLLGGKGAGAAAGKVGKSILGRVGIGAALAGGMPLTSLAAAGGLTGAATIAGGVGAAGAVGYGIGTLLNKYLIEGTKTQDMIGKALVTIAATFGNKNAREALNVNLQIDGQQVAAAVTKHYGRFASRK